MAKGHGWGGASRVRSNHPTLASATRRLLKPSPLLIQGGERFLLLSLFHRYSKRCRPASPAWF